jgi:Zn-dependent M28 family amino/carboxypeptidase
MIMIFLCAAVGFGAAAAEPAVPSKPIDPAALSETVKVLASDDFLGRAPGTDGEKKTVPYLIQRFKAMGLVPAGENGGWTQSVALLRTKIEPNPVLSIDGLGAPIPLKENDQIAVNTLQDVDTLAIDKAPIVFVGYGVTAPERDWDDFKGEDLHGKVAVFLVNDPDFEATADEPVYGKFGGKAMTYYGRWPYKFAEAARRGAAAALIVHETAAAGYDWSIPSAKGDEAYGVALAPGAAQPAPLQGWMRRDIAVDLFRRAGLDFEALKKAARRADFHPVALGAANFSAQAKVSRTAVESRNILAMIPGATHPDETVFFSAHWDAFGVGEPDAQGQTIRHGANDDGLGTAGVLEIARAFSKQKKPDRTLVFALWTAEESGLLGSEYYASHPIYPLNKTVANLTMDVLQTAGPSRDVMLVGAGQNSLEADLVQAAKAQKRTVTADFHPEKGLFYRADHFSFAKRGVPTLLIMALGGGPDLLKGGREAGNRWVDAYTLKCYHKPCDAWSPDWDLRGAAQDVALVYKVGADLAMSREWPEWTDSSEFKGVRAATNAVRGR